MYLSFAWFLTLQDNPSLGTILFLVVVTAVYFLLLNRDRRQEDQVREQEEQRARDHMVSILEDMQRSNR